MRRGSTVFAPVRCSRCWGKLPRGSTEQLCPDCSGDFKAPPLPPAFGATGVEGTFLAGIDRDYLAARIREARRERA